MEIVFSYIQDHIHNHQRMFLITAYMQMCVYICIHMRASRA